MKQRTITFEQISHHLPRNVFFSSLFMLHLMDEYFAAMVGAAIRSHAFCRSIPTGTKQCFSTRNDKLFLPSENVIQSSWNNLYRGKSHSLQNFVTASKRICVVCAGPIVSLLQILLLFDTTTNSLLISNLKSFDSLFISSDVI